MTGWNSKVDPETIMKLNPDKEYSEAYLAKFERYKARIKGTNIKRVYVRRTPDFAISNLRYMFDGVV